MSKVDWSLAPEGATHKDFTECGLWYKFDYDANTVHYWSDRKGGYWCLSGIPDQYSDGSMDDMEAKSKPWSGPEDGLPPVGTVCRVVKTDGAMAPLDTECEVIAHYKNGHNTLAAFKFGKTYSMHVCSAVQKCFSVESTPEQLSAEERERAIIELMDIADVDCRITAARLVDAGFKRELV